MCLDDYVRILSIYITKSCLANLNKLACIIPNADSKTAVLQYAIV